MFGIGSTELVIILIVALVLIGPSKLPDLMKSVGKGLSEFRRMSTDVKSTLEREIEKADEAKRIEETKKELFGDDAAKPAEAVADAVKPEPSAVPTDSVAGEVAKAEASAPATDAAASEGGKAATAKADAVASSVADGTGVPAPSAGDPKAAAQAQDKSHA